jgi:hypothetical protein
MWRDGFYRPDREGGKPRYRKPRMRYGKKAIPAPPASDGDYLARVKALGRGRPGPRRLTQLRIRHAILPGDDWAEINGRLFRLDNLRMPVRTFACSRACDTERGGGGGGGGGGAGGGGSGGGCEGGGEGGGQGGGDEGGAEGGGFAGGAEGGFGGGFAGGAEGGMGGGSCGSCGGCGAAGACGGPGGGACDCGAGAGAGGCGCGGCSCSGGGCGACDCSGGGCGGCQGGCSSGGCSGCGGACGACGNAGGGCSCSGAGEPSEGGFGEAGFSDVGSSPDFASFDPGAFSEQDQPDKSDVTVADFFEFASPQAAFMGAMAMPSIVGPVETAHEMGFMTEASVQQLHDINMNTLATAPPNSQQAILALESERAIQEQIGIPSMPASDPKIGPPTIMWPQDTGLPAGFGSAPAADVGQPSDQGFADTTAGAGALADVSGGGFDAFGQPIDQTDRTDQQPAGFAAAPSADFAAAQPTDLAPSGGGFTPSDTAAFDTTTGGGGFMPTDTAAFDTTGAGGFGIDTGAGVGGLTDIAGAPIGGGTELAGLTDTLPGGLDTLGMLQQDQQDRSDRDRADRVQLASLDPSMLPMNERNPLQGGPGALSFMGALPGDLKTQQLENQPSVQLAAADKGPVPFTPSDTAGREMPFNPSGGIRDYTDPKAGLENFFEVFKPQEGGGGHEQNIPPAVSTGPPVPVEPSETRDEASRDQGEPGARALSDQPAPGGAGVEPTPTARQGEPVDTTRTIEPPPPGGTGDRPYSSTAPPVSTYEPVREPTGEGRAITGAVQQPPLEPPPPSSTEPRAPGPPPTGDVNPFGPPVAPSPPDWSQIAPPPTQPTEPPPSGGERARTGEGERTKGTITAGPPAGPGDLIPVSPQGTGPRVEGLGTPPMTGPPGTNLPGLAQGPLTEQQALGPTDKESKEQEQVQTQAQDKDKEKEKEKQPKAGVVQLAPATGLGKGAAPATTPVTAPVGGATRVPEEAVAAARTTTKGEQRKQAEPPRTTLPPTTPERAAKLPEAPAVAPPIPPPAEAPPATKEEVEKAKKEGEKGLFGRAWEAVQQAIVSPAEAAKRGERARAPAQAMNAQVREAIRQGREATRAGRQMNTEYYGTGGKMEGGPQDAIKTPLNKTADVWSGDKPWITAAKARGELGRTGTVDVTDKRTGETKTLPFAVRDTGSAFPTGTEGHTDFAVDRKNDKGRYEFKNVQYDSTPASDKGQQAGVEQKRAEWAKTSREAMVAGLGTRAANKAQQAARAEQVKQQPRTADEMAKRLQQQADQLFKNPNASIVPNTRSTQQGLTYRDQTGRQKGQQDNIKGPLTIGNVTIPHGYGSGGGHPSGGPGGSLAFGEFPLFGIPGRGVNIGDGLPRASSGMGGSSRIGAIAAIGSPEGHTADPTQGNRTAQELHPSTHGGELRSAGCIAVDPRDLPAVKDAINKLQERYPGERLYLVHTKDGAAIVPESQRPSVIAGITPPAELAGRERPPPVGTGERPPTPSGYAENIAALGGGRGVVPPVSGTEPAIEGRPAEPPVTVPGPALVAPMPPPAPPVSGTPLPGPAWVQTFGAPLPGPVAGLVGTQSGARAERPFGGRIDVGPAPPVGQVPGLVGTQAGRAAPVSGTPLPAGPGVGGVQPGVGVLGAPGTQAGRVGELPPIAGGAPGPVERAGELPAVEERRGVAGATSAETEERRARGEAIPIGPTPPVERAGELPPPREGGPAWTQTFGAPPVGPVPGAPGTQAGEARERPYGGPIAVSGAPPVAPTPGLAGTQAGAAIERGLPIVGGTPPGSEPGVTIPGAPGAQAGLGAERPPAAPAAPAPAAPEEKREEKPVETAEEKPTPGLQPLGGARPTTPEKPATKTEQERIKEAFEHGRQRMTPEERANTAKYEPNVTPQLMRDVVQGKITPFDFIAKAGGNQISAETARSIYNGTAMWPLSSYRPEITKGVNGLNQTIKEARAGIASDQKTQTDFANTMRDFAKGMADYEQRLSQAAAGYPYGQTLPPPANLTPPPVVPPTEGPRPTEPPLVAPGPAPVSPPPAAPPPVGGGLGVGGVQPGVGVPGAAGTPSGPAAGPGPPVTDFPFIRPGEPGAVRPETEAPQEPDLTNPPVVEPSVPRPDIALPTPRPDIPLPTPRPDTVPPAARPAVPGPSPVAPSTAPSAAAPGPAAAPPVVAPPTGAAPVAPMPGLQQLPTAADIGYGGGPPDPVKQRITQAVRTNPAQIAQLMDQNPTLGPMLASIYSPQELQQMFGEVGFDQGGFNPVPPQPPQPLPVQPVGGLGGMAGGAGMAQGGLVDRPGYYAEGRDVPLPRRRPAQDWRGVEEETEENARQRAPTPQIDWRRVPTETEYRAWSRGVPGAVPNRMSAFETPQEVIRTLPPTFQQPRGDVLTDQDMRRVYQTERPLAQGGLVNVPHLAAGGLGIPQMNTAFKQAHFTGLNTRAAIPKTGHLHALARLPGVHLINSSSVPGRTDRIPMRARTGSYVLPADVVSGLGQGNTQAGAKMWGQSIARSIGPMGISNAIKARSFNAVPRPNLSMPSPKVNPKNYMGAGLGFAGQGVPWRSVGSGAFADGGDTDDGDHEFTPIITAGGECIIDPEIVEALGGGDHDEGKRILAGSVDSVRKQTIAHMKKLPGPVK